MNKDIKSWGKGAIILLCLMIAIAASSAAISYGCIADPETGRKETFYIVVGILNLLINGFACVRAFIPILKEGEENLDKGNK